MEGSGVAEVKVAGGRWGEAAPVFGVRHGQQQCRYEASLRFGELR